MEGFLRSPLNESGLQQSDFRFHDAQLHADHERSNEPDAEGSGSPVLDSTMPAALSAALATQPTASDEASCVDHMEVEEEPPTVRLPVALPAALPSRPTAPDDPTGEGAKSGTDQEQRKRIQRIPWSKEEHRLFLLGLTKLGKGDWASISRDFVTSRTPQQVRQLLGPFTEHTTSLARTENRFSVSTAGPDPSLYCLSLSGRYGRTSITSISSTRSTRMARGARANTTSA